MGVLDHSSAWNKHKVGLVLLDNWVEDRLVSTIQLERDPVILSKRGHTGLLCRDGSKFDSESNSKLSYRPPPLVASKVGKRSELRDRTLREQSLIQTPQPIDSSNYCTTSQDIGPKTTFKRQIDLDLSGTFSAPITLFNQFNTISSKKSTSFTTPIEFCLCRK